MTLPKVARVFFAIDLPEEMKTSVGRYIAHLKKTSKTHGIRWTRPENLHITLQFLAEVKGEHIANLIANVERAVKGVIHEVSFWLGHIHLFPNPYRPRVIVLEIHEEEAQAMAQLAEAIGVGIRETNYETETRPFRAHLTIGRIKQPHGINLEFLKEVDVPQTQTVTIEEVILFRSQPDQHGSKYSVLEKIKW